METVKGQVSKITANLPGALVGGVAVFFIGRKYVENKWALGGLTVLGVVLGAMGQAKFFAKTPTVASVPAK